MELTPVAGNVPIVKEAFERESLGDRAYRVIKDMIITRELEPSAAVPESVLAKSLGISRSPIKAALTRLHKDGLVVGEAWKVPRVAPLDAKYVTNVYEVRRQLESLAATLSLTHLTNDEIADFKREVAAARKQMKAGSLEEIRAAHFTFNTLIADHCDNELLQVMVQGLQDHLARVRAAGPEDDLAWLNRQAEFLHEKARALEARDPERLVAAVTEHLDAFCERVLDAWGGADAHVPA